MNVISYEKALKHLGHTTKYLMLGNGFSIALRPDIFTYGSLYENADFSKSPNATKLFETLGTRDFEIVIKNLVDAARVVSVYAPEQRNLIGQLQADAAVVKDALVQAIAKRHPDRPYDINPDQYAACRAFLASFGHVYTLNYDVLLYWTVMQDEVDDLDLHPDDGFRHPEQDPNLPYVSWQQANSPTIHFLHGALHLFDAGSEIIKYTWSKTDVPIVDQIRAALDEEKYPLFVAEGDSQSKKERILHNAYLHKALRSFEGICNRQNAALVIYGHSLAENDAHILRFIEKGKIRTLLVSIYGDPGSKENKAIESAVNAMIAGRPPHRPLEVTYFDAKSAGVWG